MGHVLRACCASALIGGAAAASASPVSYSFSITATEGSVNGNFIGDDLDSSGILSLAELRSFSANATGTAFTGGPILILAANAVLSLFSFDVGTQVLSFNANNGNGFTPFNPGYGSVTCNPCSAGSSLSVRRDGAGFSNVSNRSITNVGVTPQQVPEPASWLLAFSALVALAGSARIPRGRGA